MKQEKAREKSILIISINPRQSERSDYQYILSKINQFLTLKQCIQKFGMPKLQNKQPKQSIKPSQIRTQSLQTQKDRQLNQASMLYITIFTQSLVIFTTLFSRISHVLPYSMILSQHSSHDNAKYLYYYKVKLIGTFEMSAQQPPPITMDLKPLAICSYCVRVVPIIIIESYMLFMFVKELLKSPRIYYDKLDKTIFFFSALSISVDLISIVLFQQALSELSYVLKLLWVFPLLLVFLRFVLDQFQCSKWFVLSVLTFLFLQIMSVLFLRVIQIKYALFLLYTAIGVIGLQQIISIRQILQNEKSRKKDLKRNMQYQNQNQIQLLQKKDYQYKILSNQFKYHIYLRKSFCFTIITSLMVSYIVLWDLEESRNLIGEFFVVVMVEMLTPGTYFFFAAANQWIIKRTNSIEGKQFSNEQPSLEDQQ